MNEREPRDWPAEQPAGQTDLWPAERSDVVFVYSGHGSRWSGAGRRLLATEPAFADAIDDTGRDLPVGARLLASGDLRRP